MELRFFASPGGGGDSCISALEDGSFLINRVNIFWLINEFFAREEYNYVREIFFSLKSSLFIKEKGFLLREKISVKDALICFQSFQLNNQNKFFANFAKKISKEIG